MTKRFWLILLYALYLLGCTNDAATGQTTVTTPTTVAQSAAVGVPTGGTRGQSRGYLTTPSELKVISQKAAQGIEPYHSAVNTVVAWANRQWKYQLRATESCKNANTPAWLDNEEGGGQIYARALAYHLTQEERYAEEVKTILQAIMTQVKQININEQQCRLNFGWGTPELVASADLIEGYWHDQQCTGPLQTQYNDTTIGTGNCKMLFQNWLTKNPYYIVSYTAEGAQSNWGAAATDTLAYIADYLADRQGAMLIQRVPTSNKTKEFKELALTPGQAYAHANELMFKRMNGYGVDWHSSNACDYLSGPQQNSQWLPVKSQITEKGIVTEDARREEQCNIPRYNGQYENYPQVHLGNNIQQCELLWRRGDRRCYDNVDNSDLPAYTFIGSDGVQKRTHLYPGRGSIERAINAIIVDAQTEWRHDEALEVAYRYYEQHHRLPGVDAWVAQLDRSTSCSQDICFGTLTHGFAPTETPAPPPTVAPPQ